MKVKQFVELLRNNGNLSELEVFIEFPCHAGSNHGLPFIEKRVVSVALVFDHNDENGHEHYKIVIK